MPRSWIGGALVGVGLLAGTGCARPRQVWFTPNIASHDMLDLFTRPEEWSNARRQVDVFKFYAAQLAPATPVCAYCGPNHVEALRGVRALEQLHGWGIDVAIEAPALKKEDCDGTGNATFALSALASVRASGPPARYVAMDEPLLGGEQCELTLEETAARTARFVRTLREREPELAVGDIEPYPRIAAARLVEWLQRLDAAGTKPAFFHVDVDRTHAARIESDVAGDLRALQAACADAHIPFGVIFWGSDASSNSAYAQDVLDWAGRVLEGLPEPPEHLVFQSWVESPAGGQYVPDNLPDDEQTSSHTRLIRQTLGLLHHR